MNTPQSLLLFLLFLATTPSPILSWGQDGHELVGNLAYHLLAPSTQAIVQQILVNHPLQLRLHSSSSNTNTPLGDVADWADQVRSHSDYHWSGALHYIDIHDTPGGCPVYDRTQEQEKACHFQYERDCVNDVCVAGAIVNYTKHLGDYYDHSFHTIHRLRGSAALLTPYKGSWHNYHLYNTNQLVQESLMFLTHFIGDIHQPLHSARESDRGGNSIHVTFTIPNQDDSLGSHHGLELHAVWDTSIIERAIHTEYNHDRDLLEQDLLKYIHQSNATGELPQWIKCADTSDKTCTSQWAEESWQNALQWAYANVDGTTEVISGTHLTDEYYETRWPQIQHYLAVAGVRLATALEMVLGGKERIA